MATVYTKKGQWVYIISQFLKLIYLYHNFYDFSLTNKVSMKSCRLTALDTQSLARFLWKLDTESFLGNECVGEDDPVGETDSSSGESSDNKNNEDGDRRKEQRRDRNLFSQ